MKRFTLWATVAVVVGLMAFVIVRADARGRSGWCGHGWHRPGPGNYVAHALNLSDAQRTQIKTIWQAERPTVSARVQELLAENKEMNALAAEENPDQSKVEAVANRQASTIAALLMEKEKMQSKIYGTVLNPDQRVKADELEKRWESRLDRVANHLATQPK
ncbi:hypothetical protein GCM10011507_13530 [Edaphobacter acidisoli]|uniref:Periplasmic heavy metal sensor n=1 Tax=Edaphobacter acidisoli TaxID=2040573 RepID=A0A916RNL4_9BACT|nr:Spy/CpxP family protein refolding chaperone [Edaphobacter acidisoli]GGA63192.1 hypothetical protein GCM10011507_13530 [Edaphobacter acidisoli]